MEFDNENSRCVSAGPEPDARVCVILRGEEVEIELKGRSMDLVKMAATALMESIKKGVKPGCWRLALAVNGTIGAVGVGLVVGSGLPAALCLTPWDWPLTLAGAVLAGAACVVECALTDRYTRP